MARQMLIYHLVIPVAVFVGLLLFGVSFTTAVVIGLLTGCLGMIIMMVTPGGHDGHRPPQRSTDTDADARHGDHR